MIETTYKYVNKPLKYIMVIIRLMWSKQDHHDVQVGEQTLEKIIERNCYHSVNVIKNAWSKGDKKEIMSKSFN